MEKAGTPSAGAPRAARSARRPRLVLVDDHELFAAGIARLVESRFDIIGQCRSAAAGLELIARERPDAVLLDMSLADGDGLEVLERIRHAGLATRIVMLTQHESSELAAECLRKGASAYVLKRAAPGELFDALAAVLRGQVYVSPRVRDAVHGPGPAAGGSRVNGLTPRQRDVLRLLAGGKSMKQCAAALGLTPKTVEYHKYEMMRNLGLRSSAELVQFAVRSGLVVAADPVAPAKRENS
jgi:DNA-binding NarL/FixJ family response regulator